MDLSALVQAAGTPSDIVIVAIGLLVLFFQLVSGGYLKIGKNGKSLGTRMDTLTEYVNHQTTERLEQLLQMEEKEHEMNAQLRATLQDIRNSLANLEKYGVVCRDK